MYPILSLIIANCISIYGVLFLGWSTTNILILYWLENIVIGMFNILKMWFAEHDALPMKLFYSLFFLIHYGMFTAIQGAFVLIFTFKKFHLPTSFLTPVIPLYLSHGISFIFNYIGKQENSKITVEQLMLTPYKRIFIMQVTLVLGAMLVYQLGNNIAMLVLLVILKTGVDVFSHKKEHEQKNNETHTEPLISLSRNL